jgi:hypothetical protein
MREQAAHADPLAGLTDQERRILELIGEGLTNRQGWRSCKAGQTSGNAGDNQGPPTRSRLGDQERQTAISTWCH